MKKITTLLKRLEARTLLWTNPNPNASFTSQNVSLPNVYNVYDYIEVEYKANSSQNTDTGYKIIERTPCHSGTTASLIMWSNSTWVLLHRARRWVPGDKMQFDGAFWNSVISASSNGQDDSNMIPYRIYGIRKLGGGS